MSHGRACSLGPLFATSYSDDVESYYIKYMGIPGQGNTSPRNSSNRIDHDSIHRPLPADLDVIFGPVDGMAQTQLRLVLALSVP
jgi:hypothetical protein